jgi:hypothetical protein
MIYLVGGAPRAGKTILGQQMTPTTIEPTLVGNMLAQVLVFFHLAQ